MKKEFVTDQFNSLLVAQDASSVETFYQLDFSEFTADERLALQLRLFAEDWHREHEELALDFQRQAHPMAIEMLYKNAFRVELDGMEYKPLARKCTWALADIGTAEAKAYLEQMAKCGDEMIEGFAQKRLDNWENELPRKGRKLSLKSNRRSFIPLHSYQDNLQLVPRTGMEVTGHQTDEEIIVYQAYKKEIANYAQANQELGGNHFSFNRMSWIKPNFLWMMYRSGWAEKENQERVLAISISKSFFYQILEQGVLSTYREEIHERQDLWKASLAESEVRIQWDPEHDPYGAKQDWRVIQIGMKGDILKAFGTEQINYIEDVTDFVKAQKKYVDHHDLDKLALPTETKFPIVDHSLRKRLGMY